MDNNQEKKDYTNIPRKNQFSEEELEILEEIEKNEADWWKEKMKRRDATKKVVGVGIGAVLVGYLTFRGCDDGEEEIDPNETETSVNALDLQKKEGWNAGHPEKQLEYKAKKDFNSLGNTDYKQYCGFNVLLDCWKPENEKYLPYFVPTLMQVVEDNNFKDKIQPICDVSMKELYLIGLGFKEILKNIKEPNKTLFIADLYGPDSVAFAAALSDVCVPVVTFDNWPHPLGVVPSHLTLATMVYYAEEVKNNKSKLKNDSPMLLVLDRQRFEPYINAEYNFDNRYMAKLPTVDNLKKLGIENVSYLVFSQDKELDDINDDFATYKENNINVNLIDLSNFKKPVNIDKKTNTVIAEDSTKMQLSPQNPDYYKSSYAPAYYYGGHHSFMPFFFMTYSNFTPYRAYRNVGPMPNTIKQTNYTPVRRQTIFSSTTLSSARGIGKTRPTGFGSISTRINRTTGRMTGMKAGRTGSFGRMSSFGRSS